MKRYKRESQSSYALGTTVCFELLTQRKQQVRAVYVHPNINESDSYFKLLDLCEKHKIAVRKESKIFNVLSPKENCFVIGEFEKYPSELSHDRPHIALVSPSGSGNVGTIMRTMLGFGFKDLALVLPCADPFSPETVRSSMGAVFSLNVKEYRSFEEYVEEFKTHAPYPFMLTASKPVGELSFLSPYTLIFGNEARGLDEKFAALGQSVIIPCSRDVDSLNLSVAAAIAMYEAKKRT